jgi:hypothetical protein
MIMLVIAALSLLFVSLNKFIEFSLNHVDSLVREDQEWSQHASRLVAHLDSISTHNQELRSLAKLCAANPQFAPTGLVTVQSVLIARGVSETLFHKERLVTPNLSDISINRLPMLACGRAVEIVAPAGEPFAFATRKQSGFELRWPGAYQNAHWDFSNKKVRAL